MSNDKVNVADNTGHRSTSEILEQHRPAGPGSEPVTATMAPLTPTYSNFSSSCCSRQPVAIYCFGPNLRLGIGDFVKV